MFKIYDLDMQYKDLPRGVRPLDIVVSSINKEVLTERIENVPGKIRYGSTDGDRQIELKFYFKSDDTEHYRHIRNSLYGLLSEPFYVVEKYFPDRRYLVELSESFNPARYDNNKTDGELVINVTTVELPYAESKEPEVINELTFFVDGNKEIEPYRQHLKIEIKNVDGSDDYLELRNLTNNSYFRVNEAVEPNDEIIIDGVLVTRNGGQALRITDKTFIVLEPGKNEIVVQGAQSADVKITFRNYYK